MAQTVDGPKGRSHATDVPEELDKHDGYKGPLSMWEVNRGRQFQEDFRKRHQEEVSERLLVWCEESERSEASVKGEEFEDCHILFSDSGSEDSWKLYSRSEGREGRRTSGGMEMDYGSTCSSAAGSGAVSSRR